MRTPHEITELSRVLSRWCFVVAFLLVFLPNDAPAQETETDPPATEAIDVLPDPLPEDGPSYQVSEFIPRYSRAHVNQPLLSDVSAASFRLGLSTDGYIAPREGAPIVFRTLDELAAESTRTYYASAVQHVIESVRNYLVAESLLGVYVAPDPNDLSELGDDRRPEGVHAVRLILTTGVVTELRTLASGDRVPASERINHPWHESIRQASPVRPLVINEDAPEGGTEVEDRSLLRKDELDRFIYHLGRHPGRRVDVAVSAAVEPGGVALDYMVAENPALTLYAQISNTGTRQTDYVRERFGLIHTQLTNNDDVLAFDFVTAGFTDDANAATLSYEAPFEPHGRLRWRLYGGWSEFTADQVGFFNDDFVGKSWQIGAELIANVFQAREMFVDVYAGARFLDVEVDNRPFAIRGREDFWLLTAGARLDRQTELVRTNADVHFELNVDGVETSELIRLGRTNPDDDWFTLQGSLTHSFYLEPLFDIEAWDDPNTPGTSTLAHEILLELRAQTTFGDRIVPQGEMVAGGLYTVRGHPESAVAGDDVFIARAEYRYHMPRALGIEPEPRELFGQPFRVAPQYVYGRPDWDLILKGFVDVGVVNIADKLSFEDDETLVGLGVGLELILKRNLTIRMDWGFAAQDVDTGNVNAGSNRLHVVGTLVF